MPDSHFSQSHEEEPPRPLSESERALYNEVSREGSVCGWNFSDEEGKVATRLVRRGYLYSWACSGCEKRHYGSSAYPMSRYAESQFPRLEAAPKAKHKAIRTLELDASGFPVVQRFDDGRPVVQDAEERARMAVPPLTRWTLIETRQGYRLIEEN